MSGDRYNSELEREEWLLELPETDSRSPRYDEDDYLEYLREYKDEK